MSDTGLFVATELFADVVKDAKILQVDPHSCIPFINVRSVVKSGVQRMKFSYTENTETGLATGAVSGAFLPTVVELKGSLSHYVVTYFVSKCGLNKGEAEERAGSRGNWFGVVDGCHRLLSLLELCEEHPERWQGFKWSVMLLAPGKPLSVLRAFARGQNLRQSDNRFVETTQYDLLKGLQDEVTRLTREFGGRPPTAKELAESYSASNGRTSSTLKALANVALKLSVRVVAKIGEIVNHEDPRLACEYYGIRGITTYNVENVSVLADCRIYRHFLSTSSLRQATTFMRQQGQESDDVRIHTLCRLREWSKLSGYKPVPHRVVNEQFNKATAAMKEARKFEEMLQSETWPFGMEKLKENLLDNIILDEEVERNDGNDWDILPIIRDHFVRCCPQKASLLEARYNACRLESRERHPNDSIAESQLEAHSNHEGQQQTQSDGGKEVSDDVLDIKKEKARERLEQIGICCFEMNWQHYNRTLHTTTDELFDLILTEPPSGITTRKSTCLRPSEDMIDESEMNEFAAFGRRVVVPGGYVLTITNARNFRAWVKSFRANDFSVMDYPFVIVRDTSGVQKTNLLLFPQNVCDFVVMAVCPGRHPTGFKPDFKVPYNLVGCRYKRKFAVMDKVEGPRKRLKFPESRAPVRVSERNVDVLAELLVTFSPEGARIMDPYAGTMTTAAACMATSRKCVLIEKDKKCYDLAFQRLGIWSELYVSSSQKSLRLKRQHLSSEESDDCGVVETESSEDFSARSVEPDQRSDQEPGSAGVGQEKVSTGTHELMDDTAVHLLLDGEVVGNAEIQKDDDGSEHGWRTTLHGHCLSQFAKDDEDLVVIWRVNILEECKEYYYPYRYGGSEAPIRKLGEMSNGFFAWDLNAVTEVMVDFSEDD